MIENGRKDGRYVLVHGGQRVPFRIAFTERKRLVITVRPDMQVEVSAPCDRDIAQVLSRVERRATWILKQRRYFEQFQPTMPERRFVSGETHVYLGRQYRLKVAEGSPLEVKLIGRYFHVQHTDRDDASGISGLLENWYFGHAKNLFEHRLRHSLEECRSLQLRGIPSITVRKMKRRWGSCTKAGNISLNVELSKTPVYCIDYVLVHELCHLRIHSHTPAFYRLLTRCMPDWEKRKERLDLFRLE